MMMWMAKLMRIRTCACPGPAAGCSSTRRRTPPPCSTPTTSPSSTAHWSWSRWKWLFLMRRTILPGPSLRPLTHLGDNNWTLRTFPKLRIKFMLKKLTMKKCHTRLTCRRKPSVHQDHPGGRWRWGEMNSSCDKDLDCMHIMNIHTKNVWCCGEGYFGQNKFAEKVRKSRQNVDRDKSA